MNPLRTTIVFFLVLIGLGWWIVVGDVYTSMAYSNSFAWLSPGSTTAIVYGSMGIAFFAGILAILDLILHKERRYIPYLLLAGSILIVPAFWFYAEHVADTTEPAILQKR